ncbi:hypothetical protein B0T11DRAFT_333611 [Plectosphaerella cucumerina]|uniref:Uncharacterized protein n=1 Tax=Plectosphaerella cucumerina TaxID=40658 RepID=A0A8K0T6B7_9PEZI|nr:hypothetical protein B0T11DRAFT_333611 [Plectosphaerella cucumerina]
MQFSILLTATAASVVVADLHDYATCRDRAFKGVNEYAIENPGATQAACNRYRARNTGNKQWDKCPDCSTSYRGDVLVCNSPAKHIGGDEWEYYCRQSGADYGAAN